MKAPISFLSRYVDIDVTPAELQTILTGRGLEVSGIEELGRDITGVVLGKVTEVLPHPDADKLVVCKVDVGSSVLQIVTGASNVFAGSVVPVATHGATLSGGTVIKTGELRGVKSEGMLCSGGELNITEYEYKGAGEHGILIIQESDYAPLGTDIRDVLGLNDIVLEAEPTPNRPDLLSMIGIAREIAAALGKELRIPEAVVKESGVKIEDGVKAEVLAPALCLRYVARTVRNIRIAPSPKWMQRCLRAAGMRPINNIVDITNFVMLETGQPMHAFDLACIGDDHIIVRTAHPGEITVSLDSKQRALTENMLVIADPCKAVGIAGIMGGENSEITAQTKVALFESAKFNGPNIRRSSKALGMATEASARFCKGIDVEGTASALERACALVCELDAGDVDTGVIDICSEPLERRHIIARPDKVNELVALRVPAQEMAAILNSLCMKTQLKDGLLDIEIPHFRDDMEGEPDVSEEIARVVGYDKIPLTLMKGELARGKQSPRQHFVDELKQKLSLGFYEAYTYSFTGQSVYDKLCLSENSPLRNSVKLINPFGEDTSLMRTTAAVGMLPVIATNAKRKVADVRFYEISNVHTPTIAGEIPAQKQVLCMGTWGAFETFFSLKGVMERMFFALNIGALEFETGSEEFLHPGRTAKVFVNGRYAGYLGEVHPNVAQNFDIPGTARAYISELDVDVLFDSIQPSKKFVPLPKFPSMTRDLAVIAKREVQWGQILEIVRKQCGPLLKGVELFDIYVGENIQKGYKSLAFSMTFCDDTKTLTDEEINTLIAKLLKTLDEKLQVKLRT